VKFFVIILWWTVGQPNLKISLKITSKINTNLIFAINSL